MCVKGFKTAVFGGGTGPADPAAAEPIITAEGHACACNVFAQLRLLAH